MSFRSNTNAAFDDAASATAAAAAAGAAAAAAVAARAAAMAAMAAHNESKHRNSNPVHVKVKHTFLEVEQSGDKQSTVLGESLANFARMPVRSLSEGDFGGSGGVAFDSDGEERKGPHSFEDREAASDGSGEMQQIPLNPMCSFTGTWDPFSATPLSGQVDRNFGFEMPGFEEDKTASFPSLHVEPPNYTATWDPFGDLPADSPALGPNTSEALPFISSRMMTPNGMPPFWFNTLPPGIGYPGQRYPGPQNSPDMEALHLAAAARQIKAAASAARRQEHGRKKNEKAQLDRKARKAGAPTQDSPENRKGWSAATQEPVPSGAVLGDCPLDERTTIMVRNLPNNYSRDMFIEMLDAEGFEGCYNFVYMPMDFLKDVSFGYAFLNLVSNSEADRARLHLQGYNRWSVQSRKICDVAWSGPHQGLNAHVERFRSSPVMHEDVPDKYKPVTFENGSRIAFPAPTKRIRKPRMRHNAPAGWADGSKAPMGNNDEDDCPQDIGVVAVPTTAH